MQLTKTNISNSAIFIKKVLVENWLWVKSEFLWGEKLNGGEGGGGGWRTENKIFVKSLQNNLDDF